MPTERVVDLENSRYADRESEAVPAASGSLAEAERAAAQLEALARLRARVARHGADIYLTTTDLADLLLMLGAREAGE
jgi:hypothetical protein